MENRKIWQHLYEETYTNAPDGITVSQLLGDMAGCEPTDIVDIWKNEEENECTIYIGAWRMETDEEVQKRIDEAERVKTSAARIDTIIAVSAREYKELKEKAWKYDELTK